MDPFGVLLAILGLTVYPGGLFIATVSWLAASAGRAPFSARGLNATEAAALIAAGFAASLAPLPGSPVAALPPNSGAAPNLLIAAVLLSAALALIRSRRWSRGLLTLVAVVLIPALLLAARAASLSLPVLVSVPGATVTIARLCAAATLLIAAPVFVYSGASTSNASHAVLTTTIVIIALSLLLPAPLRGWSAVVAALLVGLGAVVHATIVGVLRRMIAAPHTKQPSGV